MLLAYALVPSVSFAQVNEYQLKAAFLYNFAKFIEWPAQSFQEAGDPITICVLGQNPFGDILRQTVTGKPVGGRSFEIRLLPGASTFNGCHILFAAASQSKRFREIEPSIKTSPILTVGETPDFLNNGGMIGFKVEHGNVRLEINLGAADFAQIKISSKLLSLAEVVRRSP